jgi:CDP-diacylglycerol--serine O-phosphatidyltransferase
VPTVPAVRFLPNAITVLAVSSGLTAVAFALSTTLQGHYTYAIGAIALAAILDSLDGPAARLLHSQSRIGAELDSLSDCVSFGVAPALVIYIWGLSGHTLGWAACLVYAACTLLRLARFNSLLDDPNPKPWAKGFFTGIPSPAGALLAMVPLLMWIRFGPGFWSQPWPVGLWLIAIALLMISRIPTIALKSVRVPPGLIVPLLVLLVVGAAALFYEPHLILLIGLGVYLLHLPYAAWRYRHLRQHPELWSTGGRTRLRRSNRRPRLSVRMPRRRRVAGRAPDGTPLPLQPRTFRQPRRSVRRSRIGSRYGRPDESGRRPDSSGPGAPPGAPADPR